MNRIPLFPSDLTDADIAAFTAAASDWPGAPVEPAVLDFCDWQQLQDMRHSLRGLRAELAETKSPSARDQTTLRVCARALQQINAELDARTSAGSREPRARPGRHTPADAGNPQSHPLSQSSQSSPSSRRAAAVFARPSGGVNGFDSLGAFALAAIRDPMDTRLRATSTYQREGVGADGGFAVPVQFVDALLDQALEQEVIRPRANVVPLASGSATLPAFDLSSHVGAKRGGLQLLWMGEAGTATDQKSTLRDIVLKPAKGAIFVSLSSEVFEDMPSAATRIGNIMSAAVAAGLDYAFLAGNGTAQPLGILNSPCLITQTKESAQASGTLLLANLAKMVGRLAPRSYRNATWLLHPTVIPALVQMTTVIKNVAGTENVGGSLAAPVTWGPDGSLTIFGRPAVVTDACAPLSTVGDIVLADLGRYVIGLRRDATLQTSIHAGWSQDLFAMRLILRVDGTTEDNAATTLRDGTNTVSPFVCLESR